MKSSVRRESAVEALEARIAPAFTSGIVNLADLSGANGSKLQGANAGNFSGSAVSAAGDVNGDGFDDFVVGEEAFNLGVGAAAVIFGTATGFPANVTLDATFLDGTKGFRITGGGAGDRLGGAVSAAGDVNGDGFDDLIVGARFANGPGAAYVIFGKANGFAAQFSVSSLDGTSGFKISEATAGDRAGISVSGAGDVNRDGFDDVIVGADGVAGGKGAAFLIYGKARGFAANLPLSGLTTEGVQLNGVSANDGAGVAVSGAGDVNGDGFADVIVGAPKAEGGTKGAAYVVFGGATLSATIGLETLTGSTGFKLNGVSNNDGTGGAVSGAGDVNGDGFADVIVGASKAQGGNHRGAAHVVFGKAGVFSDVITLDTLNGVNGFSVFGPFLEDFAGAAVSGAGDVNGDGFADLVIGAPQNGTMVPDVGDAYVIFGHAGTFTGPNLGAPDGANFFKLHGVTGAVGAGTAVSGAGDVNGDGFADLLVSNPTAGSNAGASYLVLGGPSGEFVLPDSLSSIRGKINAVRFTDVDGDLVTVSSSKPAFNPDGSNVQLLKHGASAPGAQLLSLTLTNGFGGITFDGADITFTVKRAAGGDGKVNVGFIDATGVDLGKVTVSGDLGRIVSGDADTGLALKSLTVGSLGFFGGRTADTGIGLRSTISGGAGSLKVAGDLDGARFEVVRAVGATNGGGLASVTVGGSLIGGKVADSGAIDTIDRLGAVKVGGDLIGGLGFYSGSIYSGGDFGNVSIAGDLRGAGGRFSGAIQSVGKLGNVTIGGSQLGGVGYESGAIDSQGSMGMVRIAGDQVGSGLDSAIIYTRNTGADLAGVSIGGDARAGAGKFSGGIFAGGKLGPVAIAGDVLGTATAPYVIQGQGALTGTKSVAITSVKIGGGFTHGLIRAGFDGFDNPTNGHAQIGAITVGRDWVASSVTAGLTSRVNAPDPSVDFGNGDDVFAPSGPAGVVASIASITIKGRAAGSLEPGDRYGIVAEMIGSVTLGGVKLAFTAANKTDGFFVGPTPDFVIGEVARI
ncbi:MAG: integrin alpha [Chthoniobacteraceae bacterium]